QPGPVRGNAMLHATSCCPPERSVARVWPSRSSHAEHPFVVTRGRCAICRSPVTHHEFQNPIGPYDLRREAENVGVARSDWLEVESQPLGCELVDLGDGPFQPVVSSISREQPLLPSLESATERTGQLHA